MKEGVVFTRSKYVVEQEHAAPPPSLRICVSAAHSKKEVERAIYVLKEAVRRVKVARKLVA
jgi:serine palmitoyltransferase